MLEYIQLLPLLILAIPFLKSLYDNRETRRRDVNMYLGASAADTVTIYKRTWNNFATWVKYLIVWRWMVYSMTSRTSMLDFAYKFSNTSGRFYITKATRYDDDIPTDITNLIKIYLVLFPHNIEQLHIFFTTCYSKYIIRTTEYISGDKIEIEYVTKDGIYSITFDVDKGVNLSTGEDLMFGEMAINPDDSKLVLKYSKTA